ncbi:2-C-methyl-D-erythritol 4-phosphate cytidylyltransferase [Aporhodopirellula aestuarii]|uniref:2-C-methyl-D-erythritol 4-phosphate cytidylyltransferase n=1 Tax=Aporhodopirellula aestuarii TaxID=2950107 RepID=A0ABT0U7W3_9BACT|nr:2-C-methyl-D-erythritol 4-phosphate cytidylyltransferase [Aporhodopirellula aestuarii]MCM2373005.1 2-C-methyl-D-erythritol 4-phosphate cytidylyltransferase [Aporhodopirellula aestuarii]
MTSLSPGSVAVILPAAGSGRRFGEEENKLFALLGGRPLWTHAAEILSRRCEVGRILLAVSSCDRDRFEHQVRELTHPERFQIVIGGEQRSDTVAAALAEIASSNPGASRPEIGWVAIHDAARPLVRDSDLDSVFARAAETEAAILATPVTGTLKRTGLDGDSGTTFDRRGMWVALTPQVFQLDLIRQAYQRHRGRAATDDAEMVERMGHPVALVPGAADNLKITYPEDLLVAEALLSERLKRASQ